jgi:hypothetical protein
MRPLAGDVTVSGGTVVVDWVQMTHDAASGTFLSRVLAAGGTVTWETAAWTRDVPAGTSLVISVRQGNTATPDSTWTPFPPLAGSRVTPGGSSRYLPYRAQLATTVPGQTPVLRDITIGH